jgi:4-alpha-glucanotransferase
MVGAVTILSHRFRAPVIVEDLGTAPPNFRNEMHRRGMRTITIPMFQRERADVNPPLKSEAMWSPGTVVVPTNHDTATLAGMLSGSDERPPGIKSRLREWAGVKPKTDTSIAVYAFLARAARGGDLVIVTLRDMLGMKEPTQIPGTTRLTNWSSKYPWLEDIETNSVFAKSAAILTNARHQHNRLRERLD